MDKKEILIEIVVELSKKENRGSYNDKPIIMGGALDRLVFEKTGVFEKNVKYEFRDFLKILGIISKNSRLIEGGDNFTINDNAIKKFLGAKK